MRWTKQISPEQVRRLIRAERDTGKALLIFDSATAEYPAGFCHDRDTFALMISRLAAANRLVPAESLLARMRDEGCLRGNGNDDDAFLPVILAYGRAHRPLDALRVFRRMRGDFGCEPSQSCHVTVLAVLVEANRLKLAHAFYNRMVEAGVHQCTSAYNVLIKAFCKSEKTIDAAFKMFGQMPERGCPPDAYTYSTLISGLCKLGRVEEAIGLFKEMGEKGCAPTVVTYSAIIHGFCLGGRLDEAVGMLEQMVQCSVKPNVITYSSLMDGLCKHGRSLDALALLERMVSEHYQPNTITYSTLVDGLCREGKLQEAVETLDRMRLQGKKPDAGLYSKLITGLCECGKSQEAANFLDEMVLSGVVPNRVTWSLQTRIHNMVVRALCVNKDLHRAFQVYLSMRTRSISTEPETFHSLVESYCRKGDVHKAARIVNEMLVDGCVPDHVTWGTILGGFWDRRKVREAAESLCVQLMGYPGSFVV